MKAFGAAYNILYTHGTVRKLFRRRVLSGYSVYDDCNSMSSIFWRRALSFPSVHPSLRQRVVSRASKAVSMCAASVGRLHGIADTAERLREETMSSSSTWWFANPAVAFQISIDRVQEF